jgi:hypothetical protein
MNKGSKHNIRYSISFRQQVVREVEEGASKESVRKSMASEEERLLAVGFVSLASIIC